MIMLEKLGKKYFGVKDKVDYVMVYVINIYVEKLKMKRKERKTKQTPPPSNKKWDQDGIRFQLIHDLKELNKTLESGHTILRGKELKRKVLI